jgi:hypothetical protein
VIGDVAQRVAADVEHLEPGLAQHHDVAAATTRSSGAMRVTSAGPTMVAPVAALTAALPPAWSGCQWVLRIRSSFQPSFQLARIASASGVSMQARPGPWPRPSPGSRSCPTGRGTGERSGAWRACSIARRPGREYKAARPSRRLNAPRRAGAPSLLRRPPGARGADHARTQGRGGLGRRPRPGRARPRLRHPVLRDARAKARRAVAPCRPSRASRSGRGGRNQAAWSRTTALPFPNAMFDRVLAGPRPGRGRRSRPPAARDLAGDGPFGPADRRGGLARRPLGRGREAPPSATAGPTAAASWKPCCARPSWSPPAGPAPSTCRR